MKDIENLSGIFKDKLFRNNIECFGISSDLNGEIIELFYDGLNIADYISTQKSLLNLIENGSHEKVVNFLETIRNESIALDWELNILMEYKIKTIHFSGFLVEDKFLIFGANSVYEMIRVTQILNNLNNNKSSFLKDFDIQLPVQRVKDNELFEEIGRLNNELTNTKRELTKKNMGQKKLIEKLKEQSGLLKERDEEFRNFFDNSMDAVILSITDGPILNVNSAAEKMFGYTCEEICKLGRNGIADHKNPNFQELINIKEHNGKIHGEHCFIKKDGTKFLAEISANVYKDKNGNSRTSIIIRDITVRKKAEDELKRSHQKIDEILKSVQDSFYVLDHNYNFVYINQTAAHYLSKSEPQDFIGRNIWEMFPKDLGTPIEENYKASMNKREIKQFEIQSPYSNIYFMVSVYPTHEGISILAKDISEYKNAEKKLSEQSVMLANINDAVIGTDVNYHINYWSKAAEKMYGYTEEEMMGQYSGVLRPEFLGLTNNEAREQLESTGNLNVELIHTTKDGKRIIVDSANQTLYNEYGNRYGMIGINRDITERKNAENQIKSSLNEKEVLIREIHHRVKNNLQIIASLLHLQESTVNNDVAAVLRESEGRVRSMASIHENLYQSPTFNDINIKTYIEKLVYDILYTYGIPKGNIKTNLDIQEIKLNIDTSIPLGLVINELVTNIVKYAFKDMKGTITIKLKSYSRGMELIIADDGIGLPEDIDIENSETLGLQLIHSLINQLDGKLEIDTTNGTEFKIRFNELKYKKRI
ncbi:PAS domain S-box protein [Methanobacterium sp.]|uniref:PAS domain-containing sensor histidine kinase n=1 Tax=Methanobacterium sp. TaxID=2164 RepID=UPI003C70AE77